MNDARKADRLRIVLLARYREPTMLDLREAECRDLSLGGMFVATARPSPRGGLIRFECESNAEGESFRGTARVVWQRSKPDPRGPAGMGVRFVHLEPASREALSKLVARVAQSTASMPAASPAHRSPATETNAATVLPIVELGGPPSSTAAKRSSLAAPTLRGVAPDTEDDDSNARARFDRTAIRSGAPPPQETVNDARNAGTGPGAARVRTDPPPNLVRSPDRPRSDRPPAAGAVNDEPAWSMPRDRTRLDGSGAASARAGASASEPAPAALPEVGREPSLDDFGSYENSEPSVKILGNRALNSTAPGLGGPAPSSPPENDPAPTPISDTRELARKDTRYDNGGGQQSPRSTIPEHAPRGPASDRPPAADAPVAAPPAPRERASERPQGYERPSQRPAPRDRMSERPQARDRNNARDRITERPPAPGGIDVVLRPQHVVHLPAATVGEPSRSAGSPTEGGEVWQGQRAGTDPPPARSPSWDPPPASAAPARKQPAHSTAHDVVEEAEILGSSGSAIPRLSPPRSPVPESLPAGGRSWGTLMLWLVIGSGLVVAVVLSKLFGSAPPGLPDQDPALATDPVVPRNSGDAPLALRYRLVVLTDPPGANVTVGGTTLVSPAEFGLADMEKPILVSAALPGRMSTSMELNKLQFAPRGERFERELKLTLPALEPEETQALQPEETQAQPAIEPAPPDATLRATPKPVPATQPRASTPATPAASSSQPVAQPGQAQPFGTPVLPDRPRVMPPLGTPITAPSTSTTPNGASAVGSSLNVTPSAATGSLSTVTASSANPSPTAPAAAAAPAAGDAFKRATDCLLKGDNACVIRELEPTARSAQELEMLIETYRATRDHGNAERHMARYVAAYPSGRRAGEYSRMLQRATPPATPSSSPGASSAPRSTAPGSTAPASTAPASTTPAAPVPKNPLAPPMPPDMPTQ